MGRIVRLIGFLVLSTAMGLALAADLRIINRDGRREGFRDRRPPDADSAIGGNPGTTLGQQRLIAFRAAAAIWAERIQSPVRIRIDARFNPLLCSASLAVLGAAGPTTVHRDFRGARASRTWYVQALANALAKPDADLSIVVADTPDPVPQGGTLTYDITVLNGGPGAATNVTLTDPLPGGVEFLSASRRARGRPPLSALSGMWRTGPP